MADVQETKSSLWRREEQKRRWNVSETNRVSSEQRKPETIKVKFEDSYVILAAISSGDIQEVEALLSKGADINTANIDGLTGLHQACIDDNLEMVRFLVEHKADINASDNEGWTPLHATASCGLLEVAKYLIDKGADIAAVNNDGELALDLADGDDMEELLQEEMDKQGVDADAARDKEENIMLRDANQWLSNGYDEEPHYKTGATALHCAAAKGYTKVMEVLIQAHANIDAPDLDGWTPLHAAAHWGMDDSCKVLVENLCNMDIKNNSGQTAVDIVHSDIKDVLQELKEKQVLLQREDRIKDLTNRAAAIPYKRRSSVTRMSVDQKQNIVRSNVEEEREMMRNKVVVEEDRKSSESSEADETADDESGSSESSSDSETEKKNEINRQSSLNNNHGNRQVNGTTPVVPISKIKERDKVTIPEPPTTKIEETPEIKPPPPKQKEPLSSGTAPIATPRIQDYAKTGRVQRNDDKENERLTERTSNKNTALTEKTDKLQKDSLRKDNINKEREEQTDKKTDEKSAAKEKAELISGKIPLGRVSSAPSKISNTTPIQVPSFVPKPPTTRTDPGDSDGPSAWRAGLRKTGSLSTVPDTHSHYHTDSNKNLTRSISSPWLSRDRSSADKSRLTSTLSGDSLETKNRYDLHSRGLSLYSSGRTTGTTSTSTATTTAASLSRTTAPTATSTTYSGRSVTTAPTSTSLTSSYTYTPYVPLPRHRSTDTEPSETRRDRYSTAGGVTTAGGTATATTTSTGGSGRRSYLPPARDEEKEVERKARARYMRETRRSTQGVSKEDFEKAELEMKASQEKERSRLGSSDTKDRDRLSSDDKSDKENKPNTSTSTSSSSLLRHRGITDDKSTSDNQSVHTRLNHRDSALTADSCNIASSYSRSSIRAPGSSTTSSITTTTSSTTASRSAVTAPATSAPSATTSTTVSSTTSSLTPYSSYRSKYLRNEDSDASSGPERRESEDRSRDQEESPSQKPSASRTRRKRESRKATGVVNPEDIQAAKQKGETETKDKPKEESIVLSESLPSHPEVFRPCDTPSKSALSTSPVASSGSMGSSVSKSDKSSGKSEKKSKRRSSIASRSEKDAVPTKSAGENGAQPAGDKLEGPGALAVETSVEPMVTTSSRTTKNSAVSTASVTIPAGPVMTFKESKVTSDEVTEIKTEDVKIAAGKDAASAGTRDVTSTHVSPKSGKAAAAPKAEVESIVSSSSDDEDTAAAKRSPGVMASGTRIVTTSMSTTAPSKPARTPPQTEKVIVSENKASTKVVTSTFSSVSSRPFTYTLTSREPTTKVHASSTPPPKAEVVYKPVVTSSVAVATTVGLSSTSQSMNKPMTESSTTTTKVTTNKETAVSKPSVDSTKPDVSPKPASSKAAGTSTRSSFTPHSRPTYAASRPYANIYNSSYSAYSSKAASTAPSTSSSTTSSGSIYTFGHSRTTNAKTPTPTTTGSDHMSSRSILVSSKPLVSSSTSSQSATTYRTGNQSAKLAFVMSAPDKPSVTTVSKDPVLASKPATVAPNPVLYVPRLTNKENVDPTDTGKSGLVTSSTLHNGPAVSSTEVAQDTLTICGICEKQLNQPKMLPCIHSFCRKCLETLIHPRAKSLKCPTCEDKSAIPKNGVDGFRDNGFLMHLRGSSNLILTAPKWCDICEIPGRACERQCVDCQEPMCKACATAHLRMKATKRHRVVELSDSDKKSLSKAQALMTKCDHHMEPVTMFCTQCDAPVCDTCVLEAHGDHRAVDLTQAAGEKRMVLQVTMSAFCQKAAQLQSLMSAIDAIRSKITSHQQLQLMAVNDKLRDLVFAVQRAARAFVDNVEKRTGESLSGIAGHYNDCHTQLRMFQTVIGFGNKLLDQGAPQDIVLIEKDLVGRLKTLNDRLKSLQNQSLGDHVEKSMFVFLPGISADVELRSFFGDLSSDSSSLQEIQQLGDNYEQERRKAETGAVKKVQLRKAKEPWVPYFQQDTRINPTSSPILQVRQRYDLCTRSIIRALNNLTTHNVSTQVLHIQDCKIDTEPKLEKFCDQIVVLASGHPALVPTLALLCRTLTFISVPNEKRPTTHSTVLNFLDRFCLKRFETSPGEFLATGMTPQISRSNSLSAVPLARRSGSRSSLYETFTLPARRPTTPTASRASMTDVFERNRSMYGSFGGPRKGPAPPPPSSRHYRTPSISSTLRSVSTVGAPDNEYDEPACRRRNLCILSFLCELYKLRMVAENIVHEWIQRLSRLDNDLATEAICAILLKIGRFLDHDRSKPIMDKVFVQLGYVSGSRVASSRLRCIAWDVIRLRQDNWKTPSRANYWRNIV